jgi:hypothetical protein
MVSTVGRYAPRRAARRGVRALLAAVLARPEPVDLIAQRFNFLPQRFRRRGAVHRVRAIVAVWERADTRSPRRYFRVVCHDGSDCLLYQDLRLGTWHALAG